MKQQHHDAAMTIRACAAALGVSRGTVLNIEKTALKKCRRVLADKGLPPSVMIPLLRSL